jgi:hypothetical protein
MSSHARKEDHEITGVTYPALRSFFRGYFHEDMADEYGTLEEAARTFYEDADADERKSVAGEWNRFLTQTKGQSLSAINKLMTEKLGSACRLQPEEIEKITLALEGRRPASRQEPEEEE